MLPARQSVKDWLITVIISQTNSCLTPVSLKGSGLINTIKPINRICIFLLLAALLVVSAGCITNQSQVNATPTPSAANTSSPQSPEVVATPVVNQGSFADHGSFNILRGEPFTITGTVPDQTMTAVQIWLLNGSTSTTLIPVKPDGTFQVTLDAGVTAALSRNFTSAIVAQYPSPPDHFAVNLDPAPGQITGAPGTPDRILTGLNNKDYYPTTKVDYLGQAITSPGTNNSCIITFLNGVDAWLDIAPIEPGPPGTMTVAGDTSLPAGTPLSIEVTTASTHPTPKNYDYSHEIAEGSAVVTTGTDGINHYSGAVNTSLLNTGRYMVLVSTGNENLQAEAHRDAEVIAPLSSQPGPGNYINWSALALPTLAVNETLQPVLLAGEWKIVPPGTSTQNNEVPYGSIVDCGADRICRIFDRSGVQFLAVYDSNEAHMMEVPNGAMIDSAAGGNVTIIRLNGDVILTKIDEYAKGN